MEIARHQDALASLANHTQIASIVACDTCLQNIDRHQGNLLVRPHSERQRQRQMLVPIDWGSCFFAVAPDQEELLAVRERRTISSGLFLTEAVHGVDEFTPIVTHLGTWSGQVAQVRGLVEWLPGTWHVPTGWKTAIAEHLLRRIDVALEVFSDAEKMARLFPNWQYTH
jgi:hypothetical protein